MLCSTDSEAYQYAYGTPMRQASVYSEVEIDPATTEDQPPVYDNTEYSPQKAESANDWQLVSLYEILNSNSYGVFTLPDAEIYTETNTDSYRVLSI